MGATAEPPDLSGTLTTDKDISARGTTKRVHTCHLEKHRLVFVCVCVCMLEAVFSKGRGSSETSHQSVLSTWPLYLQGKIRQSIVIYLHTLRMIGAGSQRLCRDVCILVDVDLTEMALCVTFCWSRRRRRRRTGAVCGQPALESSHKLVKSAL